MSVPIGTRFRRASIALGLLTFTLSAVALAFDRGKADRPGATTKPTPLFSHPTKAKNPITLQLQGDERQVVGWISGGQDDAGRTVQVFLDGKKVTSLEVGRDNTFTWKYTIKKPATAEFRIDEAGRTASLKGSIFLTPPPAAPGPCAFFVVDRTAYRPGQPLHFAAFLRKQDAAGEFVPVVKQTVEVDIVSERKQTRAARLKRTSDEWGRIVGSYSFTDGDALDHYTVSIPGYKGSARVLLGEYRKSKVRLRIAGAVEGEKMKLTFEALDFLDKPVPVTRASFVAQVVRREKQKSFTLKAEDFVHHEPTRLPLPDLDSLSEEDLLLREAEGVSVQTFPGLGNVPLAQLEGTPRPSGAKPIEHVVDLKKEWLRGDCALIVQGVITGADGREQRASTTLPLERVAKGEGKKPLTVTVPRKRCFTGEAFEVRATGAGARATLVVMKLSFQSPSVSVVGFGSMANPIFGRRASLPPLPPTGAPETLRRTLVTAVPMKDGSASLTLAEPGAYKLIAVVPRDDGTSLQEETTIVVKRLSDASAVQIQLDREEYPAGERLRGTVHSRLADAHALLTLRDSTGIRLVRPITFREGLYRIDEPIPAGLRYGCTVDVACPEDADLTHVAHAFARVVPADRMLSVDIKTPGTVAPGATVDVDLQVNRREPVDLVVSVYDQSLLGIAADRATNIRDFFLADTRAGNRLDAALLARKVGGVRLASLFAKAERIAKAGDKLSREERTALENLLSRRTSHHLYAMDMPTLLRLAGVEVHFAPYRFGNNWYTRISADGSERLLDLLRSDYHGWHFVPRFVGNTLLLQETHNSYVATAWHPVYGWHFGAHNPYGMYGYSPWRNLHWNSLDAFQLSNGLQLRGRSVGRGDAAMSWGNLASANSMFSYVPEGQGFLSHLPAPGAAVALLDADSDQSHLAVRRDFSDSAFWNAGVRTDETGKARVSFKLPDSLTNWQVVATAVSSRMHVGSAKASFRTYKPIMVWPMLPRTFTEGDRVLVFASVHNRTDKAQKIKVRLKVENGRIVSPEEKTIEVPAKANAPVYWTFVAGQAGFTQLLMSADCAAGGDASLKRLPVIRAAAEEFVTASGTVREEATIEIPRGVDPRAARLEITFAPSLAADLADTLNYLVDYPYGCVEQTMSRFLPAIKVAQILRQFKVNNPALEKKLPGCVAGGIKRLLELQQGDGGWGWHGNGQTHEMMTPYALFGLLQAEKAGYQIPNENAVGRGLQRLETFIAQQGDAQAADRVYCMYVYSHRRPLQPAWWTWLETQTKKNALSDYALALALEMAVSAEKKDHATVLAKALRARAQTAPGQVFWKTARFSRWGDDPFEVTAAAMKALVAYDRNDALIDGILGFFNATKRGDRWNSTKDTAMILYALTDYLARAEYDPKAMQGLTVSVNGGPAHAVKFDDGLTKKVVIPGIGLKEGKNTLKFRTAMTGVLYRAVFRYWKSGRAIEPMDQGVKVVRKFYLLNDRHRVERELKSGDAVPRGSYVVSVIEAAHRLPVAMRYVLVENPRPGSGEPVPADDPRFLQEHQRCTHHVLREDREAMTCFHHEETPQTLTTRNVFLCELAGEFIIPPARVEMMYQTQTRGHSGSFVLRVMDRADKTGS